MDTNSVPRRIEAMVEVQSHRGPDDTGVYFDGALGFGHNRLSIIDLSPAGHQPFLVDDGRLAVVFNGEIFNYRELRVELESLGHKFVSDSDTEVVARAYDEWGTECTSRFNGMWGIALYDSQRKRLFCTRDRFGVKPFHYAVVDGEFLFASEIKALLAARPELAEADHNYIARYLRTSLVNDDERTFFRRVRSLLPAHSMIVDVREDRIDVGTPFPHWTFDVQRIAGSYDFDRPVETFRDLLSDAVRLRLRSDVPVGTCLSGGLDSSSIVALASAQLDEPVRTFSSVYREPGYDEGRFVDIVNRAFDTKPYQVESKPDVLLTLMPKIAWHQDEPTSAPGVFSQWHVMEMVHGRVTVILDGQGSDELLGGYEPYFADAVRSYGRRFLSQPSSANLRDYLDSWGWARERLGGGLWRTLALSYMNEPAKRMAKLLMGGDSSEVRGDYLAALSSSEDPWAMDHIFDDRLANALYDSTIRRSVPALLRYEDRNSMAFSLEARTPFLDYRLVEFSLALPFYERIAHGWTKYVLRRGMEGTLPDEITWRKDKMGYPTPLATWLRGPFAEEVDQFVNSPEFRSRDIFDMDRVDQMWDAHKRGAADHSWNVWRWLSLEYWFRTFIDAPVRPRSGGQDG